MRVVLRTSLGRLVRPFALLEFTGRRSGRRFSVPVGWHEIDSGVVVTPAPWRENFRDGLPVTVWFHGQRQDLTCVLDDDPNRVAVALQSLADTRGRSARSASTFRPTSASRWPTSLRWAEPSSGSNAALPKPRTR